ncbi:DNA replication protein [Zavarzinia compransoris]|uniref:DNA replication protein n=1 Tax=Zavarzinia marina TaxID=2911065 RepID=UPI001F469A22|nr:DNA replication protein [Zavarzinia marina]MCF4164464.1 DNA replication protein [Zavarzinia marina]
MTTRDAPPPEQIPLDLPFRAALGRDDLIVHAGNETAVQWLGRWPDWPGRILALIGPAASGKSHLSSVWAADAGALRLGPGALSVAVVPDFAGHPVLIEDADGMADETALFHLINLTRERGGSLLLTARSAPARWPVTLPDLRSRLGAVPVARLGLPDEETLKALMAKLLADRQLALEPRLLDWVVTRIDRTPAAVAAMVAALDRESLKVGGKLGPGLVRRVVAARSTAENPDDAADHAAAP